MARFFQQWPVLLTRVHADPPDDGGSGAHPPAPPHPTHGMGTMLTRRGPAPGRSQRLLATRAVRDAIVSLAGVIGRPVRNQDGAEIGRLDDVVCRWTGDETYPPVTGLVVRVGPRLAFVDASTIDTIEHTQVLLKTARLDLSDFPPARGGHPRRPGAGPPAGRRRRRPGHPGRRPVPGPGATGGSAWSEWTSPPRPCCGGWDRHGGGVSHARPGHRLGRHPAVRRTEQGTAPEVRLRTTNEGLERLRPGELADLLEDLAARAPELLASLGPRRRPTPWRRWIPRSWRAAAGGEPARAAEVLAPMEPDEAVDALRDLD